MSCISMKENFNSLVTVFLMSIDTVLVNSTNWLNACGWKEKAMLLSGGLVHGQYGLSSQLRYLCMYIYMYVCIIYVYYTLKAT
jgi:hypothetical protein